jgi:DNA-binding protein HU-beta
MNKTELIASLTQTCELILQEAEKMVAAFFSAITHSLEQGDDVALIGFGSFSVRHRPERKGRNPGTGKEIILPASKAVAFKPGSKLKTALNRKAE